MSETTASDSQLTGNVCLTTDNLEKLGNMPVACGRGTEGQNVMK